MADEKNASYPRPPAKRYRLPPRQGGPKQKKPAKTDCEGGLTTTMELAGIVPGLWQFRSPHHALHLRNAPQFSSPVRDRPGPILAKDREEWGACNSRP